MGVYYMLVCDKCREFVFLGKMHIAGGVDGEFLVREELDRLEKYMCAVEELDASWTVSPPLIIYAFLTRHEACKVLRQIPDFNDEFYEVENDPNYKWLVWAYDYYKHCFGLMEKWLAIESKILLLWNEYSASYPSLESVVDAVMKDSDLNVYTSEKKKVDEICMRLLRERKLDEGFEKRGIDKADIVVRCEFTVEELKALRDNYDRGLCLDDWDRALLEKLDKYILGAVKEDVGDE